MRISTWNIRAGGGKRLGAIADVMLQERADVIVLTEFRPGPGQVLLDALEPLGYQATIGLHEPQAGLNCTCVLTRSRHEAVASALLPKSVHRWVSISLVESGIAVLGIHVPNQHEAWNKTDFLDCVMAYAAEHAEDQALILGDLNTALDEDCQGDPIRAAVYLQRLANMGWVDGWRLCNPTAREYSWYSHKANGFRLDHCLVSPSLAGKVASSEYNHNVRLSRLSDHSLLTTTLSIQPKASI